MIYKLLEKFILKNLDEEGAELRDLAYEASTKELAKIFEPIRKLEGEKTNTE